MRQLNFYGKIPSAVSNCFLNLGSVANSGSNWSEMVKWNNLSNILYVDLKFHWLNEEACSASEKSQKEKEGHKCVAIYDWSDFTPPPSDDLFP